MKTIHKKGMIALCMLASSCMSDLNIKSAEIIDQSIAFKSVDDLNAGTLGAYAGLATNTISISTWISDEATWPAENTSGRGTQVFSWKQDAVNVDIAAAWTNFYMVLDRVNRVLGALDDVYATPQEESTKQQLKGELLALRAFCHFELLRHYAVDYEPASAGVPVMTRSYIGSPARNTVQEVFAQIDTDLETAKTLIPTTFTNKNRITRPAVAAIQARSALWQKKWDVAITAATEVINAIPLASATAFPDIWLDKTEAEIVWKLKREAQDARIGDIFRDGSGRVLFAPSYKWMNAVDASKDVRFGVYAKDLTPTATTRRWTVNKYVGGQPALVNLADVKLFRVAEMYLIRAEAYASKTTVELNAAASDLNALRIQRISGYVPQSFVTAADLLDAVMLERYRELAFEGHRYFDLRRRKMNITRTTADAIMAPGATLLTPGDRGYYLPIPLKELQTNLQISQHPKYND